MRFRQDKAALFGAIVIIILILLAIFAGVISNLVGHGPNDVYQADMTDDFGIPKGPELVVLVRRRRRRRAISSCA